MRYARRVASRYSYNPLLNMTSYCQHCGDNPVENYGEICSKCQGEDPLTDDLIHISDYLKYRDKASQGGGYKEIHDFAPSSGECRYCGRYGKWPVVGVDDRWKGISLDNYHIRSCPSCMDKVDEHQ